jgi:hypothetical protein
MKKMIFCLLILNFAFAINSYARKPAVEDFVGVESQDYKETPKGTEVIFNFGQHIQKFKQESPINNKSQKSTDKLSGAFGILAIFSFIALPFLVWFGITTTKQTKRHLPSKPVSKSSENVANLSDYRSTNDKDDQKKAS